MRKIRLSEMFSSFQGEGRFTGMPSLWVRFFGCNLKCEGFGQKDPKDPSTYILPYKTLDVSKFSSMAELPVFEYGCDSSYSWSPRYKRLAKDYIAEDIVEGLVKLGREELGLYMDMLDRTDGPIPWHHLKTGMPAQLCFTGGEPMLHQEAMTDICDVLYNQSICPPQITIETNATVPLEDLNIRYLTQHLHISCSPKLYSVSGEKDAVDYGVIAQYTNEADSGALKFVHNGTDEAWDELDSHIDNLKDIIRGAQWQFWIMPVGSVLESQDPEFLGKIATEGMKRGFLISHRTHISVFGNKIGK